MQKAFLFDMDGVLVDSERVSLPEDHAFFAGLFGEKIADAIGDAMGVSIDEVYKIAIENGATMDVDTYRRKSQERSASVYERSKLASGVDTLVENLVYDGFKIALVSATTHQWLELVLSKLEVREKFDEVISVNDVPGLRSKPAPDGFLEALRRLNADPKKSFVLEDSNRGIKAGKASGCYTIGFRGYLVPGYTQEGADAYADTMEEVARIVTQRSQT